MRTTLEIDDVVLAAARTLAEETGTSLGAAVSELARRGLRPIRPDLSGGIPVFRVDPDAPPLTPEMVRAAAEDA